MIKLFYNGYIYIEFQSYMPEKFINLLWKNNIIITEIKKINITTMVIRIKYEDYRLIKEYGERTGAKIRIVKKKGMFFLFRVLTKRVAMLSGIVIFIAVIYYLSTFIWGIDINSDGTIAPYEIRCKLKNYGIHPGILKSNVNVYDLEEKMLAGGDLMWIKLRINGSHLQVDLAERKNPPTIVEDNTPCDLISKRDCQILRIYTTSGTALVNPGDIVKSGQIIVKGEQGKEGSTYQVHAKGEAVATTWYEDYKEVTITSKKKVRTGKKIVNIYLSYGKMSYYIRNSLNKFENYDKIVEGNFLIKKITYYETKYVETTPNINALVNKASDEIYKKMILSMDKSIKVQDKKIDYTINGDVYRVRVLLTAEENVAFPVNQQ